MHNTSSHRLPLILAIVLHVLLFLFLFAHFASPDTRNLQLQPDVNIIKAEAINPAEVVAQITQVKAQEQQKQHEAEEAALKLQQEQAQQRAAAEAAQRQKEAEVAAQQAAQKQAEAAATLAQQVAEQKVLDEKHAQEVAIQKKAEKAAEAKKTADIKKTAEADKAAEKKVADDKAKQDEIKKRQAKKDAEKKKQQKAAQELKLAQQKELESQMAAEQKELEAARTSQNQSEIEKYTALILHTMRQNWIMPDGINPEISCQLAIRLKADGTVVSVNVIRSSGNAALDNSARLAVFKSSPLPVPADKDLFNNTFREFNLTVSKKD